MNTTTRHIIGVVVALLLVTAQKSRAVVGQSLQIQGTNLVLSWPSPGGYQEYLIQYRQSLDPSSSWSELANNYFANGTDRTTYTIVGVVPAPPIASGGGGEGTNDPPPLPMSATSAEPTEPMAVPADGSGSIVPLAIYLPDTDLSGFLIYDPTVSDWVSGATYVRPAPALSAVGASLPRNGPMASGPDPADSDPPSPGFYRVFHIPDWAFNVTNYTYDGPWFFPVDFADCMDRIDNVKVLLNDAETDQAQFMPYVLSNGQTNWGMGIYFDRIPNGVWTIQLVSALRLNDLVGDGELYLTLANQVRTITVNNQITFTNWNDVIWGDSYTFNAQVANPSSDWSIDIYDAWGNYVNTGSGHTTNGQITWTWDLTDYLGNPRTDFDSDPMFYSETTFSTAGNGPATTRANPSIWGEYPAAGDWLVSFQDRWYIDDWGYPADCQGKYVEAMGSVYDGPIFKGDQARWLPLAFGTNVYSQAQRDAAWANLKSCLGLPWSRNWYYQGHGGPYSIGADNDVLGTNGLPVTSAFQPNSKAHLTSQQVKQEIGSCRYRFVFLDGCKTATGDWPAAFGIDKAGHTLDYYTTTNTNPKRLRPAVFAGWNVDVGGPNWPGHAYPELNFEKWWMPNWANSDPPISLTLAIERANEAADYLNLGVLRSALMIYGYKDMTVEEYNHAGDWRP